MGMIIYKGEIQGEGATNIEIFANDIDESQLGDKTEQGYKIQPKVIEGEFGEKTYQFEVPLGLTENDIVQSTGSQTDKIMSQKAVTDALQSGSGNSNVEGYVLNVDGNSSASKIPWSTYGAQASFTGFTSATLPLYKAYTYDGNTEMPPLFNKNGATYVLSIPYEDNGKSIGKNIGEDFNGIQFITDINSNNTYYRHTSKFNNATNLGDDWVSMNPFIARCMTTAVSKLAELVYYGAGTFYFPDKNEMKYFPDLPKGVESFDIVIQIALTPNNKGQGFLNFIQIICVNNTWYKRTVKKASLTATTYTTSEWLKSLTWTTDE